MSALLGVYNWRKGWWHYLKHTRHCASVTEQMVTRGSWDYISEIDGKGNSTVCRPDGEFSQGWLQGVYLHVCVYVCVCVRECQNRGVCKRMSK